MQYTCIERPLIQCPQGTKPGLVTQPCHRAPGDLWVENCTKYLD